MAEATVQPRRVRLFLATERKDKWWVQPLLTFLGLLSFIVYVTWAAFQNAHYHHGPYLSPLYAPEIFGSSPHAWFGAAPTWWPAFVPFSPALLILPFPAGFRFTCYYYRGAYYKAFWGDPVNCAVGEPRKTYWGEHSFPLIIQNIHRYFLYAALAFIVLLSYDAWLGFWFADGFHVNVGSLVMTTNVVLLGGYTFGCHSLRHIVGGRKDNIGSAGMGRTCYDCVSGLNRRHQLFAWCSLFSVGFTDVYIRMCSMGVFTDFRIL